MSSEACVKVSCPFCGQHLEVPFSMLNDVAQCPYCGNSIDIASVVEAQRTGGSTSPAAASSFCANCGSPISSGDLFCPNCGTPSDSSSDLEKKIVMHRNQIRSAGNSTSEALPSQVRTENIKRLVGVQVSDKWAWWIVFGPLLTGFVLGYFFPNAETGFYNLADFVVGLIFLGCDIKEIKSHGLKTGAGMWCLGIFLMPIYLFVRASEYTKKYAPAITYLVLRGLLIWFTLSEI